MKLLRLSPAALLLLAFGFLGCETQFDAKTDLSLQTKNALEVLPADVQMVGMVNFHDLQHNAVTNPFGDESFSLESISGEGAARLQDFIDATGFDPATDLLEVYVAGAPDGPNARPRLVIYADYDRSRLEAYLDEQHTEGLSRDDYQGIPLYQKSEANEGITFALANDDMIVAAANLEDVKAMLDRLSDGGGALVDDPDWMKLIENNAGGTAWVALRNLPEGAFARAGEAGLQQSISGLGRAVQDLAMKLTVESEGVEGSLLIVPREGVASKDVAALTRGIIAAMKTNTKMADQQRRLLDEIEVLEAGQDVRVRAFMDNETLTSMK